MKLIVRLLSHGVRRAPLVVVILSIVVTGVVTGFIPQSEDATTVEAFAPDTDEFHALASIGSELGGSELTIQVVLASDEGDVITSTGLQVAAEVENVIRRSDLGSFLIADPERDVVGFFTPALRALDGLGISPTVLTDEQAKDFYSRATAALDPDQALQIAGMLSVAHTDPTVPASAAGLIVATFDAPDDLDEESLVASLRTLTTELSTLGRGTIAVEPFTEELLLALESIADETRGLFTWAALIIAIILGAVFWVRPRRSVAGALARTATDSILALLTIGMSIGFVMGAAVLLGPDYAGLVGKSSPITQVIPVLLIGLGVDYAIHLTARYREEVSAGASAAAATGKAIATVGVALILATATTSVGFLTNVANPIPSLRDFGILAALGIAAAFLLMLTFLPAVRLLLDRRAERRGTLPRSDLEHHARGGLGRVMAATAVVAERRPLVALAVTLALAGGGIYGLTHLETEFSLTSFVPADDPIFLAYETLTEEFAGGLGEETDVLIMGDVTRPDVHNALVHAGAGLGDVAGVFAPGGEAEARSPIQVIAQLTGPGSPDPGFAAFAAEHGVHADLTAVPGADVAAVYARAASAQPEAMNSVRAGNGIGSFFVVRITTQAGDAGVSQLADDLADHFSAVAEFEDITATVTSRRIIENLVLERLASSQAISMGITLVAALALLVLSFAYSIRRPFLGVLTMVPVVLAVLLTYAMMAASRIAFGPATATVAAMSIGVGVPYSIHVTHRFLEDRIAHEDPGDAIRSTARHTGGALVGSAFTTMAGFGVLVTSSLQPFRELGGVVVYAILFSLLGAVMVLPSLLVLWNRWHLRHGRPPILKRPPEDHVAAGGQIAP